MSKQRYVKDSFWSDSYIESLSPDYKLLFLYLLTNPQMNIAGVYEIRPKRIAFETGYDIEVVNNILKKFQNDGKIIIDSDWIVIINFIKHLSLGEKTAQGVNRIISSSPDRIKSLFSLKTIKNSENKDFDVFVLDTPYMGYPYPSQTPVKLSKVKLSKVNSIFTQPKIEEVVEYCKSRGNKVDPVKWYDYYTSNGWHVGRNKMKDWRASVRTWENNLVNNTRSNKELSNVLVTEKTNTIYAQKLKE